MSSSITANGRTNWRVRRRKRGRWKPTFKTSSYFYQGLTDSQDPHLWTLRYAFRRVSKKNSKGLAILPPPESLEETTWDFLPIFSKEVEDRSSGHPTGTLKRLNPPRKPLDEPKPPTMGWPKKMPRPSSPTNLFRSEWPTSPLGDLISPPIGLLTLFENNQHPWNTRRKARLNAQHLHHLSNTFPPFLLHALCRACPSLPFIPDFRKTAPPLGNHPPQPWQYLPP